VAATERSSRLPLGSELNSQRELTNPVASSVADARGENLSECALTVGTLSQILARIIEVWVIGEIAKAALELEHDSLSEPEILGEPQGEIHGSGANQRPHGSVAKTANDAAVGEA
jgi:hypothetical protein